MALPVVKPLDVKLQQRAIPSFECVEGTTNMTSALPASDLNGPQRSMQDGQGVEWNVMFSVLGTCVDQLHITDREGHLYTFEEFPFYLTSMATIKSGNACKVQYIFLWPCRAYYDADCVTEDGIDWEKAAQKFGSLEAAKAPGSIEETREYMSNQFPVLDGIYGIPSIIQNDVIGLTVTWNGSTNLSLKPCTVTSDGRISTDGSFVLWEEFEPDFGDSTIDFDIKLGTPSASNPGQVTGSTSAQYVLRGTPTMLGFTPLNLNFDEVHVFDCGIMDSSLSNPFSWVYTEFGEPVHRYYVAWVDSSLSFMGSSDGNALDIFAWDYDYIKDAVNLQEMAPIARRVEVPVMSYFLAALYAEEGKPLEGKWTMPEPKLVLDDRGYISSWDSAPTAGQLVPCLNYSVGGQDGFFGTWNSWYVYPEVDLSFIGIGDKNLGFNFRFGCDGWGTNEISGYYAGKYYFHPEIEDWNKMEERSCVGNVDANVLAPESNAVEVVESNAPVVSTQYFNLQGQRLNVAPQQGIFIQREIKADGTVKATKIAK